MKKALFILIALALLAVSVPMFADAPAISGKFVLLGNLHGDGVAASSAGLARARVMVDAKVDDFNSVYIQLRGEGTASSSNDFFVKQFKLTSKIGAALGLPIGLTLTAGWWDDYMTNWWYADGSGWAFYYARWMIPTADTNYNSALKLDIGVMEGVNVHLLTDTLLSKQMFGADAAFGDFGLFVGYGNSNAYEIGKGDLNVEFKYALPEMGGFKATLYPYFRYSVGAAVTTYSYGVSVGGSFSMFNIALGIQGDDKYALDHYVVEFSVAPMEGVSVWANAFLTGNDTEGALAGIDLGASYKVGAAKLIAGYIVGGDKKVAVPIYGDTVAYKAGVYLGADIGF